MTTYSPWSNPIDPQILFPRTAYERLLDHLNCKDHSQWLSKWSSRGGVEIASYKWPIKTKRDWAWGIGLPFLSDIERHLFGATKRTLFGISGLPGSGKTSFGQWIKAAANELNWSVDVVSMDDFYLPSQELKRSMEGNPWLVPRALPGSHEIELMEATIEKWKRTGHLKAPKFDKSLQNGFGDRCGWNTSTPKILIIEGWFLGCALSNGMSNSPESLYLQDDYLSPAEEDYRLIVQNSLKEYLPIWKKFERIWHFKAIHFLSTRKWKTQQELNLQRERGASIKGKSLELFLRMIQTAIPQQNLQLIKSDVVARLNSSRAIKWVGIREEERNISK